MTGVVIASAARTAVGSFNGAFANMAAHDLGTAAIKAALDRAGVDAAEVSETIMGQILTAGQGQNPARQAHINAGLPQESAAWGINQLCGSGLRAVMLGAQHVQLGDAEIVVVATTRGRPPAPPKLFEPASAPPWPACPPRLRSQPMPANATNTT